MKYDLIVIGGGPGGYVGAERAATPAFPFCLLKRESWAESVLMRDAYHLNHC